MAKCSVCDKEATGTTMDGSGMFHPACDEHAAKAAPAPAPEPAAAKPNAPQDVVPQRDELQAAWRKDIRDAVTAFDERIAKLEKPAPAVTEKVTPPVPPAAPPPSDGSAPA